MRGDLIISKNRIDKEKEAQMLWIKMLFINWKVNNSIKQRRRSINGEWPLAAAQS